MTMVNAFTALEAGAEDEDEEAEEADDDGKTIMTMDTACQGPSLITRMSGGKGESAIQNKSEGGAKANVLCMNPFCVWMHKHIHEM